MAVAVCADSSAPFSPAAAVAADCFGGRFNTNTDTVLEFVPDQSVGMYTFWLVINVCAKVKHRTIEPIPSSTGRASI